MTLLRRKVAVQVHSQEQARDIGKSVVDRTQRDETETHKMIPDMNIDGGI